LRCQIPVTSTRRILCVFPAYTPSFGTFAHAYPLMGGVKAFMPPQGLLLIAAYLPESWPVRFVDENIARATDKDFAWADVVFVSGMHVQVEQINDIRRRGQAAGKVTVLGGPSVSGAPEWYGEFDYLHVGEMGDATDRLVTLLDESVARPPRQIRLDTAERLPLSEFPQPAYDKVPLRRYLIGSLQFSSGCPYRCEFCDIPALYGRQPRLKTADQLLAELDLILRQPVRPAVVYFVDDNFIGNRKATRDMLPELVAWQKKNGYPLQFACEATLNLAQQPEILAMMKEANFITVFVGIETPDADALRLIDKGHNAKLPILDSINTINSYGMEVTSGIIMGLDSDTPESEARLRTFVDASNVPVLTINLLQALPKTPLWERLEKADRLDHDPSRDSNVRFLMPHEEVVAAWKRCIAHAYTPERLFARFIHQMDATYVNRVKVPVRTQLTLTNLRRALVLGFNIAVRVGLLSDYRRAFWRAAREALRRGQIEAIFNMGFVSHHMIRFTQEALAGQQNASFYALRAEAPAEPSRRQGIMAAITRRAA
jgi:radical SAM superfamily enzyme YgiQ (UPF0313 family)